MLPAPEQINRILLINISHIGDIVLSCPAIRTLKSRFPQAEIDMLVSMPQGEAAYHNPYISNVINYGIRDWRQARAKLLELVQILQQRKYNLALASRHGSADPMMAWLSGAECRAGFDSNGGGKYLTHIASLKQLGIRHESEYLLALLAELGITTQDTTIEFAISENDAASLYAKLPDLFKSRQPVLILCPFSDDSQKNWTNSGYIKALNSLTHFADCVLIGTGKQKTALAELNAGAGNKAKVLGGDLSLGELGALIKTADLLITVDTGPLHIAQAFPTPTIALMGPTDPKIWGPRRPCDIVLNSAISCAPCWDNYAVKNSCQINECMQRIKPTDVIQLSLAILSQAKIKNRDKL